MGSQVHDPLHREVIAELTALRRQVGALQEAVDRLGSTGPRVLSPRDSALVDALGDVFGHASFKTCEAVAALGLDIGCRPMLRAALCASLGSTFGNQRLGLELRRIAEAGGRADRWYLTAPTKDGGQRVWCLSGLSGGMSYLSPLAPVARPRQLVHSSGNR